MHCDTGQALAEDNAKRALVDRGRTQFVQVLSKPPLETRKGHTMEEQFESLESAHDFVTLLAETVAEAKRELQSDLQRESATSRRLDALRLAAYNIDKLETHLDRSRRILNDLRTLRRLLFQERKSTGPAEAVHQKPSPFPANFSTTEGRSIKKVRGSAVA